MEYRLLGSFEVVEEGRPLNLGPRKQRAVLVELAISVNRVVPLDRLLDDLWGDAPPARAIASLQAYVSNLRRVLEPQRGPYERPRVLLTRPPGYILSVETAALDAARFEAAAAEGHRLLAEGRCRTASAHLREALSLWRGPALADFAYERFARAEAARLDELHLVAVEDRIQADLDLGGHEEVVAELEELVATHRLRERLWGLLMLGLARSGRPADALNVYARARQTLAEELGIDPGPALRRLAAAIDAGKPPLAWALASPPVTVPVPAGATPPVAGEPGERPLVGRRAELARLEAVLDHAASGRGGVVLVAGEPGIGKTRLAEEVVARTRVRGWLAVWGRGVESGGTPAFWPWVEVVRSLMAASGTEVRAAASGPGATELAHVVPELRALTGTRPDPPPALHSETVRHRLFEAVGRLLAACARHQPLVVVLDDLHWADAASLQVLALLAPRIGTMAAVVVGVYRSTELQPGLPLADALAALARHQVLERVELGGLGEAEVGCLMEAVAGRPSPADVVASVAARTGGNPFFVTELARTMAARSLLGGTAPGGVPDAVVEVVRHRLSRLPEPTVALLEMAAVGGPEFECRVLEAAAGLGPDRTLDLVEAAVLTGLVSEDAAVPGRFRFSHDLVRETIIQGLGGIRKAQIHGRVGDAVRALHDDDAHALEVAYHLLAAVPAIGPERALPHVLRAAEVATGRLAEEQAGELLRRALGLVDQLPAGARRDRQRLDVLLRLHASLMKSKGWTAAETQTVFSQARELFAQLGQGRELVQLLYGAWATEDVAARYDSATAVADELLAAAAASGRPADLVVAHLAAASTAFLRGEMAAARTHLGRAMALPEGVEDPSLAWLPIRVAPGNVELEAFMLAACGRFAEADARAEEALAMAAATDHPFTLAWVLMSLACMGVWDSNLGVAEQRAHRAIALADEKGFPLVAATAHAVHGWARALRGEATEGVVEISEAREAALANEARCMESLHLLLLAEAQWAGARPGDALRSIEAALAFVDAFGERLWEPELHQLRGDLLLEVAPDHGDEAKAEHARAAAAAWRQGIPWTESGARHRAPPPGP
jgi:DNA-binding SARP family transcriptional activator